MGRYNREQIKQIYEKAEADMVRLNNINVLIHYLKLGYAENQGKEFAAMIHPMWIGMYPEIIESIKVYGKIKNQNKMEKKKIVFITGAGISAESGISTFRDSGGLWENYDVQEVCSVEGWQKDKKKVLDFYNARHAQLTDVEPNDAHKAIASLQDKYDVTVVTQNVDDLHERAGAKNVIHLHGELLKATSSRDKEGGIVDWPIGQNLEVGQKAADGSQIRPYIVWFGEPVPNMAKASKFVSEADIVVVVGTSLQVYPAAALAYRTYSADKCYLIDPNGMKGVVPAGYELIAEPATKGMQTLIEQLS